MEQNINLGSIQLGMFSLLFPLPILAESGQQSLPQEPVDRRSFRRNLSNKIKAKKKKRFYFKNRFVGFIFLFAFSTLSFRHHNTIYRYTTFLKSLFWMNISKEHCFVMHQWEGRR